MQKKIVLDVNLEKCVFRLVHTYRGDAKRNPAPQTASGKKTGGYYLRSAYATAGRWPSLLFDLQAHEGKWCGPNCVEEWVTMTSASRMRLQEDGPGYYLARTHMRENGLTELRGGKGNHDLRSAYVTAER